MLAAPVAHDDSYAAHYDTLDTAAQALGSVLDNDFDSDSDPLTAHLVSQATYGSVALETDGHFVYTLTDFSFSGLDSFTYKANDGTSDSNIATVTIDVVKPFSAQTNQPDLPFAGAEGQGIYGTSLQTGDLQTRHPVAPGHALVYSVLSESDQIIVIDTSFSASAAVPDKTEVRLTLGGVAHDPVWYSGALAGGDPIRFALEADTSTLSTGRHDFELEVVAHYGSTTATRIYSGYQYVVKSDGGDFGPGWHLAELDRLAVGTGGVMYVTGDGRAAWFEDNGDGTFTSPPGPLAFSTLTLAAGVYTLKDKHGNEARFNASGRLTAREDRNGNTITYTWTDADGDTLLDELSQITDPFGRVTAAFTYTDGLVSSVQDLAGRTTSLAHNAAGQLLSITRPDPDAGGSQTAPQTSYAYATGTNRLSQITDPASNVWQFAFDFAGRIEAVTNPDTTTRNFDPFQVVGLVDPSTSGSEANPAAYYIFDPYASSLDELNQEILLKLDRFGYMIEHRDPLGHTTRWERDANGLVTKLIEPDPDGAGTGQPAPQTLSSYDTNGNLTGTTLPDGSTRAWVYDTSINRPTSDTDELSRTTTWTYDANGNKLTETNAAGETTTYTYTARGQVDTVTTPDPDDTGPLLASTVDNDYDAWGRLVTTTNPDASTRTFTYDSADNLLTETDELSRTWTHTYDALDRRTGSTSPDPDGAGELGATVYGFTFDALGRVIEESIGAIGLSGTIVTGYAWDWRGNLTTMTLADPDGGGPLTRSTVQQGYDSAGRHTSTTDANGNVTSFEYDADSRLITTTYSDPDGGGPLTRPFEQRFYDDRDRLTTVRDPRGHSTAFSYDVRSRMTSRTNALSGVYTWVHDAAGQLTSETDELGRVTDYEYDLAGRRTKTIGNDPDGGGPATRPESVTSYDRMGRVITQTDAGGNVTTLEYNNRSWLTKRIDPDPDGAGSLTSPVWQWSYDLAGQKLTETDPMNRVTTNEWDGLGQLVTVTDNLNNSTSFQYDILGNRTHVTDALGNTTLTEHDNLSRPVRITQSDPDGGGPLTSPITSMEYDPNGNRTSLTDPVANTTTWAYDGLNRVTSETNELAASRQFSYDATSNLTAVSDRNGRTREFDYDALNRRTEERWIDTDGTTLLRTISFAFDAAGQRTSASDPDAAYAWTYDGLGRVTSVDNAGTPGVPSVVLASAYDAVGNRTSLEATVAGTADFQNTYTFDALSRMTRITQTDGDPLAGSAVGEKRIDMAWNAAGQFDTITRYEDLAGTELVAASTRGYDAAGRLTSLDHTQGTTVLAAYTWTFDGASRITQLVSPDGTSDYSYDDTGQLTGAVHSFQTDEAHSYDLNGNRTNTGYSTGTNNRLTSDGTYDYAYDAEGNRTKKTTIATGDYVEYAWDHRNRLTAATFKDSVGNVTKQVAYTYDVLNQIIGKDVDTNGDGTFDRGERYVYDGDDIALVYDEAGSLKSRFVHGPRVDQVFASEDDLGAILWPLADNQETVRDIADYDPATDTTGIANHRTFDSFGNITAESNGAVDFLFSYTGRFWDEDTGQQNNRRRWYDGPTGRWLSEDPSGFDAGDANLYRYVNNSPTNGVDPSGLELESGLFRPPGLEEGWAWYAPGGVHVPTTLTDLPMIEYSDMRSPFDALRSAERPVRRDGLDRVLAMGNGFSRGVLDNFTFGFFSDFQDRAFGDQPLLVDEDVQFWSETGTGLLEFATGAGLIREGAERTGRIMARRSDDIYDAGRNQFRIIDNAVCFVAGTQVVMAAAAGMQMSAAELPGPDHSGAVWNWTTLALAAMTVPVGTAGYRLARRKRKMKTKHGPASDGFESAFGDDRVEELWMPEFDWDLTRTGAVRRRRSRAQSPREGSVRPEGPELPGTCWDAPPMAVLDEPKAAPDARELESEPLPEKSVARRSPRGTSSRCLGLIWLLGWLALGTLLFLRSTPPPSYSERGDAGAAAAVSAADSSSSRAEYRTQRIEEISAGDLVLAADPATGRVERKRVLRSFGRVADHLRILRFAAPDGAVQEIKTTDEHPFWVPAHGEFVKAKELGVGDQVTGPNGESQQVAASSYEPHPEGMPVYNFEVEGFHTYFVVGDGATSPPVLAHNADCFDALKRKYGFLQDELAHLEAKLRSIRRASRHQRRGRGIREGYQTDKTEERIEQVLEEMRQYEEEMRRLGR